MERFQIRRLKSNIIDARDNYIDDLIKIKLRKYNLINDETKTPYLGVIAQEIEKEFPGLVETENGGFKSVKTSVLIFMLLSAVQSNKKNK